MCVPKQEKCDTCVSHTHTEMCRYQEDKYGLLFKEGAQQSLIDLALTVTTSLP